MYVDPILQESKSYYFWQKSKYIMQYYMISILSYSNFRWWFEHVISNETRKTKIYSSWMDIFHKILTILNG